MLNRLLSPRAQNWLALGLVLILVLVFAGLGVQSVIRQQAAQAQATRYAQNAVTIPANSVVEATATALAQWPLVLSDKFNEQGHAWAYGPLAAAENAQGQRTLSEGLYVWRIEPNTEALVWSLPRPEQTPAEFYVEVEAAQISGAAGANYGLLFHWSATSFYYFSIEQAAQEFSFASYQNGEWHYIIFPTYSNHIYFNLTPGYGGNRLGVEALAGEFTFYINGVRVATSKNTSLSGGTVGLAASVANTNGPTLLNFDNFVWRVQQP